MRVIRMGHGSSATAIRQSIVSIALIAGALSATPLRAAPAIPAGHAADTRADSAASVTFRIMGSREGLVGSTTASGHMITANDHFVALPSRTAVGKSVRLTYKGTSITVPVLDVGPFNTDDDFWNPTDSRTFKGIPQGVPQAQAAYQNGHNGGKSGIGIAVNFPLGIDIGDGAFADLGMKDSDWLDVTFLWLSSDTTATASATSVPKAAPETVKPTATAPPATAAPKKSDLDVASLPVLAGNAAPPLDDATPLGDGYLFVKETNHNIPNAIAKYWKDKGGVPMFGYPLSELFVRNAGGEKHVYQYFERVLFEYLPASNGVALAPLGAWFAEVNGPYETIKSFDSTATKRYVAKTQHSIKGGILQWYAANGDTEMFGNPLNEEGPYTTPDGRTVTAQLFERARIEMDSKGTVTLGRLGAGWLAQRGWL